MKQSLLSAVVLASSCLLLSTTTLAFLPAPAQRHRCNSQLPAAPAVYGILGRFRQQKKVDQFKEIAVGETIGDVDVEQIVVGDDGDAAKAETVSIREVLGTGKVALIGA